MSTSCIYIYLERERERERERREKRRERDQYIVNIAYVILAVVSNPNPLPPGIGTTGSPMSSIPCKYTTSFLFCIYILYFAAY
jgi:hypothetical protein